MGARNHVGIGLLYRPASLCSLATQFQTRFLESIPRPMAGLKFSAQYVRCALGRHEELLASVAKVLVPAWCSKIPHSSPLG